MTEFSNPVLHCVVGTLGLLEILLQFQTVHIDIISVLKIIKSTLFYA